MILLVNKMLIGIKEDTAKVIAKKPNESYELRSIEDVHRFYDVQENQADSYPYTKIHFVSKGQAIAFMIQDGFEVFIGDKKIIYATDLVK